MKASAIIVAAGSGTRLGAPTAKAFVELCGEPLIVRSLRTIAQVDSIFELVITIPAGMESAARDLAMKAGLAIPVKITPGGAERQDSVRIALGLTSAEADTVVIHDAARPFATPAMFAESIAATEHDDGGIVGIALADTLKRVNRGKIIETVARAGLYQAQTPQAFRRGILIRAHEEGHRIRLTATDDADLVERAGGSVVVVEGSAKNLKITTAADLEIARAIAGSAAGMNRNP
jgi:2-C-methyl-D-erythritol 4-phosphate cytidylyltransferase